MHWILWAFIACILFMVTYDPRTGNIQKYFTQDKLVEDHDGPSSPPKRKTQSDSDSSFTS